MGDNEFGDACAEELLTGGSRAGLDPGCTTSSTEVWRRTPATCYLALNQPKQAAKFFDEALRLLPASCDRRGARINIGLARARLASGDGDEALRLAAAALTAFAARGSAAGVQSVCRLRGDFTRAGLPAAASALDEHARALQHAGR